MLKAAVIGLGRQSMEDHIPALLESDSFSLVAVCDIDHLTVNDVAKKFSVEGFDNLESLIKKTNVDVAIVAVPHNQYLGIVSVLADAGINIIKEKPFATTIDEASAIHKAVDGKVFMGITLQRRFNPIYRTFPQMKKRIGRIYSIEGRYTFNISDLGIGWRAQKSSAGGGALIDMGYHLIDLLIWYFGIPDSVTARISRGNRPGQKYDVEDTANMLFDFHFSSSECEKTIGNFLISRVYPKKEETLVIHGRKGIVELRRGEILRLDVNGREIEKLTRQEGWPSALVDQVDYFGKEIESGKKWDIECLKNHIPHVAVIQAAYDSDERSASCCPRDYLEKIMGGA